MLSHPLGCSHIYVRAAAPNRQSLGATNGIASTATSIIRGIGPVMSTSLFAVSIERNILGGWMVYVVLVGISAIGLVGTSFLPTHLWEVDEDADGE